MRCSRCGAALSMEDGAPVSFNGSRYCSFIYGPKEHVPAPETVSDVETLHIVATAEDRAYEQRAQSMDAPRGSGKTAYLLSQVAAHVEAGGTPLILVPAGRFAAWEKRIAAAFPEHDTAGWVAVPGGMRTGRRSFA